MPLRDQEKPRRGFTFGMSSEKPYYHVRCHNCGWTAKGNKRDGSVFRQADTHECKETSRVATR